MFVMRAVLSGSTGSTVMFRRSRSKPRPFAWSAGRRCRPRQGRAGAAHVRGVRASSRPTSIAFRILRPGICSSAHLLLDRAMSPRTVGLWQSIVELLQRLVGPGDKT